MNALICLFIGLFGIMFLGFAIGLIKAYFWEIVFQRKKRKAIKKRTDDSWIYKI